MNLNDLASQVGLLQHKVGNIESWVWPKSDNQTYGIILQDWMDTIRPYLQEKFGNARKGSVIQAGGNCGVYPLLYTEFFNHVYTFEPDPLSFFCLVNNCQLPGIVKFNAAVGDHTDLIVMNEIDPHNRGMNKVVYSDEQAPNSIPMVTLDSFGFKDVKFIQLDLEGNEIAGIRGCMQTIKRCKPIIMLEAGYVGYGPREEVINFMREEVGYKFEKQVNRLDLSFIPLD